VDLSDALFGRLVDLLARKTGIRLKEYKKYLVVSRLARAVGPDKKFGTFDEYYQALQTDPHLLQDFINALTTNYSYFYRDSIHFSVLARYLRERAQDQSYLRFWSAASSTGEEAFSIAMTVANHQGFLPQDRKILATDISTRVLGSAIEAVFGQEAVLRNVCAEDQQRFFIHEREERRFRAKPQLRSAVDFRQLNLLDPYPFTRRMDVIFLRNVMIYFGPIEKSAIIAKMYDCLKPGGLLFLGLSESLAGIPHRFESYRNSIHQKVEA
jgi:chemotaxis protein methyltransferase CheR